MQKDVTTPALSIELNASISIDPGLGASSLFASLVKNRVAPLLRMASSPASASRPQVDVAPPPSRW